MSTLTITRPVAVTDVVDTGRRNFLRDTRIVMVRELRPLLRNPFSLLFGLIQPLVFLGLFGPLLAGSVGGGTAGVGVGGGRPATCGSGSCRRSSA